MRILAYEFITGGGLSARPLPPSMADEGGLMLDALLEDLADIDGVEVRVARDRRLSAPPGRSALTRPRRGETPLVHYARAVAAADAVWPIAPETGGVLERLTRLAMEQGRRVLGCRPEAIHVAASKLRTARALANARIPVVPTYDDPQRIPASASAWVVKPDDGAGCAGALRLDDSAAARAWLAAHAGEHWVAQPWIEGDALSLSLLCRDAEAALLCCNRQHVRIARGRIELAGISVNVTPSESARMGELARGIARALPGLWGYVGVDVIDRPAGPLVVEINPRLTTSYRGLREALGLNVAAQVLRLMTSAPLRNAAISSAPRAAESVEIALKPLDVH